MSGPHRSAGQMGAATGWAGAVPGGRLVTMSGRPLPAVAGAGAAGSGGSDAWERWVIGWHLAFWAVIALGLLRVGIADDLPTGSRLAGAGLLVALGATYALTVPVRNWARDGRTRMYLVVAVLATGAACALDPSLSMLLFIVYPQTWMLSGSRRAGVASTVALTLSAGTGFLLRLGWSPGVLRSLGPQMLVSLLFSVLLGSWITRIIEQSRDRAALLAEVESTRTELARAHHAQGVMAERERLAREIHDTLAQGFTSIAMHAQAAATAAGRQPAPGPDVLARLATIEDVARENLAEARALVAAFAPVGLDGTTLPDAIRRLAARFATETGLAVEVDVSAVPTRIDRAGEVVALRTVQEALANVRRHAGAGHVLVRLAADACSARVEVRDDGVGFSPELAGGGFGLAGMRARAVEVGGDLEVSSSLGNGTRVVLRVPAPADEPAPAQGQLR